MRLMENFRVKIAGSEEIVPVVHRAVSRASLEIGLTRTVGFSHLIGMFIW